MTTNKNVGHAVSDVLAITRMVERKVESLSSVSQLEQMMGDPEKTKGHVHSIESAVRRSEENIQHTFAHLQAARERLIEADAHIALVMKSISDIDSIEKLAVDIILKMNEEGVQ